jgi:hypothetical protein
MLPPAPRKLPTVSVQLVDERLTYLVAIVEHVGAHSPRDLRISDSAAAKMWLAYYDEMLWRPAIKIVEDGKGNEIGLAAVQNEIIKLGGRAP